jgi:gamma-glutamylcyclotransferase (GGCT)/AIG2-like uncharacterized protein YtfP
MKMEESLNYLFVYGTLRDASVNHKAYFLKSNATLIGKATINARLYKVSWYPAIILSPSDQDIVHGEIYQISYDVLEMVLHELDSYEGIYESNEASDEYERVATTAVTAEGVAILCWVYNYKAKLPEASRILSGDYIDFLVTQRN